ncbi:hypothetical protein [Paenibacillus sp. SYP-B4298]|uniref:hypothetical protein n=1 Tax=Paenibacillus sp. SYP-B4298 TaxID=2996034 RepID=UPI0022DD59A0|nr:hypothetical protein [Paenibacillus sp. SYP-B4298]
MTMKSVPERNRGRQWPERSALLAVLAMVLLLLAGCTNANGVAETLNVEPTPPDPQAPKEPQIEAIEVMLDMPSASWQFTLSDPQKLAVVIAGIHEAPAVQEGAHGLLTDEAGMGTDYRLRILSAGESQYYRLSDLRSTARIDAAALLQEIEEAGEAKATPALALPTAWLDVLLGGSGDEALLRVEPHLDEQGVSVYANRPLQVDSVAAAVKLSLGQTAWLGHMQPEYELAWTDPQRVLIRFAEPPAQPVLLHFGGLLTAEGERFANANQLPAVEAALGTSRLMNRLSWITPSRQHEDSIGMQDTLLVQPVYDRAGKSGEWLFYHADGSQTRVNKHKEQRRIRIDRPNNAGAYGNEYGVDVLFSDRHVGNTTYAVYGNRTLYRVNMDTSKVVKLHTFKKPIFAVASSPDGKRVAVLQSSDDFVGAAADLLVLDQAGKELYKHEEAAYMNKSDGFIFPYSMSWISATEIAVLDMRENYGASIIDVRSKEARAMEGAVSEDIYKQIRSQLPEGLGVARLVAQSQGSYIALQTENGWLWMYDVTERQLAAYGPGLPLGWDEAGDTLAVARADSKYGLPYDMGIVHTYPH